VISGVLLIFAAFISLTVLRAFFGFFCCSSKKSQKLESKKESKKNR
jgi:hypothetical protein